MISGKRQLKWGDQTRSTARQCIIFFDKSKDDVKFYLLEMFISYIIYGKSVHTFDH